MHAQFNLWFMLAVIVLFLILALVRWSHVQYGSLSLRVLRLCIIACVTFMCLCIVFHPCFIYSMSFLCHRIILMHASHTCIIVTELSENEPVEPAESIEPEPGVPFVVEPEVNQGKQLSMNPCSYLSWFN